MLTHSELPADAIPLARRAARRGAVLLVALAVLGGIPELHAQTDRRAAPTQKQKEAELKRVNARIERVRQSVNADIEKRDKLSAQLRDAELAVQQARRELDEARAQRVASEARLKDLEREQARREAELGAERGALAGELRAAYVNGREEQLKLLLNQQDPASVGRMLAYYGYFGRARAERIDSIRDQLEHLALVRERIAAEGRRLEELEARQEQELATLRRYGVPLKIVLLDNSSLGLVRQWQELFFAENYSEIDLSDNPDFVKVAEAFGIEAFRIDRRDQVSEGIQRLLAAEGPCLAHVVIDPRDNVWPLVPPGKSNAEMMEGS